MHKNERKRKGKGKKINDSSYPYPILLLARRNINESKWKQPFQNDKNLNQQDSNKLTMQLIS